MSKSKFMLSIVMMLMSISLHAIEVVGKVIDNTGEGLPGASVLVKGTTVGTITDFDGNYKLNVPNAQKDILVFSFVGMANKEIPVKGKTTINVTLESSAIALDEVVAVGYGTTRRRDVTGSVASVKADDLAKVPTSDVTQALAGRVAGVQVTQSEGQPGASVSIRVRGGISITQSNEPLYIIDGFPSEDGMSTIDPADIESIDILKDASSTAIYGARGANGVVVITTKSGAKGDSKFTLTYDMFVGFKTLAKKLPVLSTAEFVFLDYERRDELKRETDFVDNYGAFADIAANYGNRPGIDWQDEVLGRTAISQNHRIAFAGGNKDLKYNLSYTFFDDQGQMVRSGNKKHNLKFRVDHNASKRVKVSANMSFDDQVVEGLGTSEQGANFNKMNHILQYRPTVGMKGSDDLLLGDEDPLLVDDSGNTMQNPLISAYEEHSKKEYRTFQANGSLSIQIVKGLTFKNTTGMRYQNRRDEAFYGDKSILAKRTSIQGSIRNTDGGTFQTSNVLTYDGKKRKHRYSAMAGQEYVYRWSRMAEMSATNFPNDLIGLNDMSLGTPGVNKSSFNNDDILLSFFARANYSYADKYLLTVSARADGSSKFGPNNKWGFFPSVSGAWRLAEEDFIKNLDIFSDLKLRVGYGLAGNNRIPSYGSLAILESLTYPVENSTTIGYGPVQIPNRDLKWEANKTLNIGLDFGFFNQRLTVAPEFYTNRSSNLLLKSKLPASSGYAYMYRNAGETENIGFDLSISSVNIEKKNFRWSTNFNISHNKNKIRALAGEDRFFEEPNIGFTKTNYLVAVGQPIGQMYGFKTLGLYQVNDFDIVNGEYVLKSGIPFDNGNKPKPGHWKFDDVNGDGKIDDNDRTVIGNAAPKLFGGMNNTFSYKNFDLSVFLNFSIGGDIFNATKLFNSLGGRSNKSAIGAISSANRWVTVGADGKNITDPNVLAQVNQGKTVAAVSDMGENGKFIHSWAIEDGSFLRINNITLGYTFPKAWLKKIYVQNLRLYATGNNLYTFTKYTGFDPEVSTRGNGLTPGIDWGAYPKSRSFVVGMNVTF